ncbi:MAG: flagellar basal body P-ring protein FlgI [Planctomycetota bacterium]
MKPRLLMLTRPARVAMYLLCLSALVSVGCSSPTEYDNLGANEAADTFSGPRYLRGTIGSYGSFLNNQPRYVGGYGMVVDLNATGSNEVPGFLRTWLTNEMLRNNLGSVQFGTERFGPERVMADLGSSVVAVEGLIPPGAVRGSKFDVLVTMIDQTSTSLAGGRLFWPSRLSITGLDRSLAYTEVQGAAYGELFVNPVADKAEENPEFLRTAVVVNGGTVMESQRVQFVLNQPSYRIASAIAERINAKFEANDTDNLPTAVAKNDGLVEINMPTRFAGQPGLLLELIEHLYLDPTPAFIRPTAEALGNAMMVSPKERADAVSLAWKGLGPNSVPVLRQYYTSDSADARQAALEAGAWLNDTQTIKHLSKQAAEGEPAQRVRAANALVSMTRSNEARQIVRKMLGDPDTEVRLGAYEALSLVSDPIIKRLSVTDGTTHKFYIDRVPSDKPMVFALQGQELSIVIFGEDIPLRKNVFAKLGDSMALRTLPVDSIPVGLTGRFEGDSAFIPIHRCGALKMIESLTPVSQEPDAELPPPDWRVEVGDADGNTMLVNIRSTELQDAFGVELLNVPNRGEATEKPRAVAMVRIVQSGGTDDEGNPTPPVGELLALRDPAIPLPVALRHQAPGQREARLYRITPTVASLAYTLGYKVDNFNTQTGPDLSFSEVVRALYQLSAQNQIDAPFDARLSPLAQRIASAQRDNQIESRPEITEEELEKLDEAEAQRRDSRLRLPDGRPDSQPADLPIGRGGAEQEPQRPTITPEDLEKLDNDRDTAELER